MNPNLKLALISLGIVGAIALVVVLKSLTESLEFKSEKEIDSELREAQTDEVEQKKSNRLLLEHFADILNRSQSEWSQSIFAWAE